MTMNQVPRTTAITPVYSDTNGILVKTSTSNSYKSLNSNTITISYYTFLKYFKTYEK